MKTTIQPVPTIAGQQDRLLQKQAHNVSSVRRKMRTTTFYLVVSALVLLYLVPIFWTLSTSLRTDVNLFDTTQWLPHPMTFVHYVNLFQFLPDFGRFIFNTLLIATLSTVGMLFSCSTAGYALARMRFPGRTVLLIILLLTLMVPGQVTLIPVYVQFRVLDWINTPLPLIVPFFFGNAFSTFFFRQFFMTLPTELEEAAIIDGAGRWRTFWSIIVPLSKPAFLALGLLTFVQQWNGFFAASVYLQTRDQWVMTQALQSFIGQYMSLYGEIMAGVILMSLPIIILYIFAQRYIVEGIALSGITG